MKICNDDLCTGCLACYNKCPNNAICITENQEGFIIPKVVSKKCTHCKLCIQVCPVNSYTPKNTTISANAVLALDKYRVKSSSGGFFVILAKFVLEQGGVVCGAAYDQNMNVVHKIIDNYEHLDSLMGSKYAQSNINYNYQKIKTILADDRYVLFVGCPCQVAGLYKYLNKKYDKLITADLICHGVPSSCLLNKFLLEKFPNEKILSLNFRDKINGWGYEYITSIDTDKKHYIVKEKDNDYLKAFFSNISLRKSCYNCKYTTTERVGDFTLGDCWNAPRNLDDKKGTSLILINTVNGNNIYKQLAKYIKKSKKLNVDFAKNTQPQLNRPINEHPARNAFFRKINTMSFSTALSECITTYKNIGLLNFHWENNNYGALLTAYALNYFLRNQGYNVKNINYIPTFPWIKTQENNYNFEKFRKENLPLTDIYFDQANLSDLNNIFGTFIVGSDQVWRNSFIKNDLHAFFLDFANCDKNIISYAASFGVTNIEDDVNKNKELYKLYLNNFNSISVRENEGMDYCKTQDVVATLVLDPVFLLNKNEWKNLSEQTPSKNANDIIYYLIDESIESEIKDFFEQNDSFSNRKIENISSNFSIEEWLSKIDNCNLIITDSFHCSCFAIIFNKPFICLKKNSKSIGRMSSLFKLFKINNVIYESLYDVNLSNYTVDFSNINEYINYYRTASIKWLINSIEQPINDISKKQTIKDNILELQYKNAVKNIKLLHFKYLLYKFRYIVTKKTKSSQRYFLKFCEYKEKYRFNKYIVKRYKLRGY